MVGDIVISVKNIAKTYKIYAIHADRAKKAFHPLRNKCHRPLNALYYVSFNVSKGETLDIIGRNGGGKSTLLQLLKAVTVV